MTTNFDLNKAWSKTAASTSGAVTATHDGESNVTHVVTHVSGHSDADATIQILDGSTPLAEWKKDASVEGFQFLPQNGVWVGTPGNAVSAVISATDSDSQVNIAGFSIP